MFAQYQLAAFWLYGNFALPLGERVLKFPKMSQGQFYPMDPVMSNYITYYEQVQATKMHCNV